MSVCAAPTCSHQSFDGSSYYVDVDVELKKREKHRKLFLSNKFEARCLNFL